MLVFRPILQSVRRGQEKHHRTFPTWLSFILENPIRRAFDPPSKLIDKVRIERGDSILDLGCGPGFFTLELAKRADRVFAVDISEKMLSKARRNIINKGETYRAKIEFICSDGRNLTLPDSCIDVIFLGYVFREVNRKDDVLKELKRVLKTKGKLVIVERTRLGLNVFGLPLVRTSEIIEYLDHANFKHVSSLQFGTNTIISSTKDD